jgi:hypothetical protein
MQVGRKRVRKEEPDEESPTTHDAGEFRIPLDDFQGYYGHDLDFDNATYGDSESAGGRSSMMHELPERIRAGSEENGQLPDLRLSKSRRSSDAPSLQSRFEFDQSPRGSSVISQRSRLVSVGELDLSHPLFSVDAGEDNTIFKDQSLQEEPETQHLGEEPCKVHIFASIPKPFSSFFRISYICV